MATSGLALQFYFYLSLAETAFDTFQMWPSSSPAPLNVCDSLLHSTGSSTRLHFRLMRPELSRLSVG